MNDRVRELHKNIQPTVLHTRNLSSQWCKLKIYSVQMIRLYVVSLDKKSHLYLINLAGGAVLCINQVSCYNSAERSLKTRWIRVKSLILHWMNLLTCLRSPYVIDPLALWIPILIWIPEGRNSSVSCVYIYSTLRTVILRNFDPADNFRY